MVAPAPGFYATPGLGHDEVRIAYVLKKDDLVASVRILARGLAAYREARNLTSPPGAEAVDQDVGLPRARRELRRTPDRPPCGRCKI